MKHLRRFTLSVLVLLAFLVASVGLLLAALAAPRAFEWGDRSAIRYPGLKRAVTLAECDRKQRRTKYVATGTMYTVTYTGKYFVHENSCAYRLKRR